MLHVFEWTGALLGLLGAFILATNTRFSRWGWVAFLGANVAMVCFAAAISAHGLLVQQLGFTLSSLLGLYRTGFLRLPFLKLSPVAVRQPRR